MESLKILLVYPKYPLGTFWSFHHAIQFLGKKATLPSLSLVTIAAMLPSEWEKRYVDLNVERLTDDQLRWADYVFISAMLAQKTSTREIIARCNKLGVPVVAGGPAFAGTSEVFSGVDHMIIGEAEVILPEFIADLGRGDTKPRYESQVRPQLAGTPLPLWDLVDMRKYATMLVQYSRGCPFACEFCDIPGLYGNRQRAKTPGQMVAEFQALYDAGWRGAVFIVDDNFIGNCRNAEEMLPAIVAWQRANGYPFTLITEASVNLGKMPGLLDLMRDANFSKVFLGIESPSKSALKECHKFQNAAADLLEVVQIIHGYGIQVMGGFIVGFDSDSHDIFDVQIEFIQKSGIVSAMVGLLVVVEGTPLWKRLAGERRILENATGNNSDGRLNFIPRMDPALLVAGYQRVVSTIFSPKVYYRRVANMIDQYTPSVRGRVKFEDIRALLTSFVRIGVMSRARFYYWRLLGWTLLRKASAFPVAIELAIQGHHYQITAEQMIHGIGAAQAQN